MKKSELKKILKPLIKQCIKEVVFEEGVLSGLISEVVKGTTGQNLTAVAVKKDEEGLKPEQQEKQEKLREKIKETKKKMLDAIGNENFNGVNLFEGTQPLSRAGKTSSPSPASPLEVYAPDDEGVDISSIFSPRWKSLV